MIFNDHHTLEGLHAFLGASNYHWLNWNDETLVQRYFGQFSTTAGTAIHELAQDCIKLKERLNENDVHLINYALYKAGVPKGSMNSQFILQNLIPFVNDAIGFDMSSEVILYYSMNCFGTADAIYFDDKNKILRIHDLKTGTTPAHFEQLMIYASLFCLEYNKKPKDMKIELRLYQNCEVLIYTPTVEEIEKIMDLIVINNKKLMEIRR